MPAPLIYPEDEGFFDWLDRPGRIARSLIAGEPESAGRNAIDFLADIPDAFIPNQIGSIPLMSRPEDNITGADLLERMGADEIEPGWKRTATDIGVGLATDPLTYTGIGPIAKGLGAAGKAAVQVAEKTAAGKNAVDAVSKVATRVRDAAADTFNVHNMSAKEAASVGRYHGAREAGQRASLERTAQIIEDMPDQHRQIATDIMDNLVHDPSGVRVLDTTRDASTTVDYARQKAELLASAKLHPEFNALSPAEQSVVLQKISDVSDLGKAQFDAAVAKGGMRNPLAGVTNADRYNPGTYLSREWDFAMPTMPNGQVGAATNPLKARTYTTAQELADALNATPEARKAFSRDLAARLANRAEQQGTIEMRGQIVQDLVGKGDALSDSASRALAEKKIEAMMANPATRDYAVRAKNLLFGMPQQPEGFFKMGTEGLQWVNRQFKKGVTVGHIVPNFAFLIRNRLSAIAQAGSVAGGRVGGLQQMANPVNVAADVLAPLEHSLYGLIGKETGAAASVIQDDTAKVLAAIDDAFAKSGGSSEKAISILRGTDPRAAEIVENGVISANPMRADDVIKEIKPGTKTWASWAKGKLDVPAKANEYLEQRMRAGLYLAHRGRNMNPEAAANMVRSQLLDYSVPTRSNQVFRTVVPFGAFMSQTLPQQAKLMSEGLMTGGVGGALAGGATRQTAISAFAENPELPVYSAMEGNINIPTGLDEKGNQQYFTGMGLPIESLSSVPQKPTDLIRDVVGQSNPAFKTVFALAMNKDPYFQTPFGSYEKPPAALGAIGMESGNAARIYNLAAGTGLTSPITAPIQRISPFFDERLDATDVALKSTIGARFRSVDPFMALREQHMKALQENPQISQYTIMYQKGDDPDAQALLDSLRTLQGKIREKKKADQAAEAERLRASIL